MKTYRQHPAIAEFKDLYERGRISRRDFLRFSALLGVSAATGNLLAACGPEAATPVVSPSTAVVPATSLAPATGPLRGGTMRISTRIYRLDHPARLGQIAAGNVLRQMMEYLTYTDEENITYPYLLDRWEASEDIKTWTLFLREGVKFNNGDDLTADDVIFSMKEWLDPDVGSSMLGLMSSYLSPDNIEKVDARTVRLHLSVPEIAVPEHLFHYPAQVLNQRTFEGDILAAPVGTGPYTLVSYAEGERAEFSRREDYWQNGADGQALPYLDQLVFVDLGEASSAHVSALKSGQIDRIETGNLPVIEIYQGLKDDSSVVVTPIATAETRTLRVRVDQEPWTDVRVRQAFKLCQNREKILNLAYYGQGLQGADMHVSPVHPEYCEKPIPQYDPEQARQLLADAGYPDGLDVQINVASGAPEMISYAEAVQADAEAAGFRINVNIMPGSVYWDQWTEVTVGVTPWGHRALGGMALQLGYSVDAQGKPVPWNETHWVDQEFLGLLQQASGTLDLEQRRSIFCQLEDIMTSRGGACIAFWMNLWSFNSRKVMNAIAHPTHVMYNAETWLNQDA
jgi:peptide/nickel transport system substrate-binding protein